MSALLIVIYIPSDSDSNDTPTVEGDEKRSLDKNDLAGSEGSLQKIEQGKKTANSTETLSTVDATESDQQDHCNGEKQKETENAVDQVDAAFPEDKYKSLLRREVTFPRDDVDCGDSANVNDELLKDAVAVERGDADGGETNLKKSPSRQKNQIRKEDDFGNCSLEVTLQNLFDDLGVRNDIWTKTDDESAYQISFVVPTEKCDVILRRLTLFGLGNIPDTSITTFPASFHHVPKAKEVKEAENSNQEESEFYKSIKSRLIVAQVVSSVETNARATFDFIMLICLASFIAGLGLVENSSVVLVASMLISPLMGPILGGVFGFVIDNRKLTKVGVQNATIGLLLCVLVGFVFGLMISGASIHGTQWGSSDQWPTIEMATRGHTRSLWVGVLIALPSGAAVALSILGGNVGSLVGVAISASLLPPAVNAGMLWAYAMVAAIKTPYLLESPSTQSPLPTFSPLVNVTLNGSLTDTIISLTQPTPTGSPVPPNCPPLLDNKYSFEYTCNMASEAAILGAVSLFLTLLNILCIFLTGILVLKIKEVAPHTAINEVFWKKDLPTARDYYRTIKGQTSTDLRKMMKDISAEMKELEEQGELPEDAKRVRGPMMIRSHSHDGYTVVPGFNSQETTPSTYNTPMFSIGLSNRASNIYNRDSVFFPETNGSFSPAFFTPPTSASDKKFVFPENNVRRRRPSKPRKSRAMDRQMSLGKETEKYILDSLARGPQKFGRFMVSAIPEEEDTVSVKGSGLSSGTPKAQSPVLPMVQLKAPVKKNSQAQSSAPSSPDNVVVEIGDGDIHDATSTF